VKSGLHVSKYSYLSASKKSIFKFRNNISRNFFQLMVLQYKMRLKNKVALITGGSSGIGRAASILFAKEGAKVIVVDINTREGNKTVKAITEKKKVASFCKADVAVEKDCKKMVAFAKRKYGGLHILFNNAGIMHSDDGDSQSTDEEVFDLTININVKGVFFGCKYGIPLMKASGASKGAVLAMSRELAVVHAREGIRVNALSPGPLRTELLMKFLNTAEKKQRRLVHVPMGRFGEATEMAKAALFLASDDSSYMTGTEFLVDGGITAAYVTPE